VSLILFKRKISAYTETEFVALLQEIAKEDEEAENDDRADLLLAHFETISEHPAGSDLIYYPEPGADNSPAGVMQSVREWRAAQGLPGFKDS
jgi:hypothetical protein